MSPTQSGKSPSASTVDRLTSVASHLRTPANDAKFKVVVTRDLGPEIMNLLHSRKELEVVTWPQDCICERPWFLENIKGAAGAVVTLTEKINDEVLDAAGSNLKVISTVSVGYDHVDLKALAKRGVKLGHTPDVLTEAVADLSIMLALMASRNTKETTNVVQTGGWPNFNWAPFSFCGPQLSANWIQPTKTAGFLGFGRIAQATLARLIPFGYTHILYTGNPLSPVDKAFEKSILDKHPTLKEVTRVGRLELARGSDVVFVLAPGGEATKHIVSEEFLREMKKSAVLVNTSRGTLVDSHALTLALREGWIWGAGLDVVEGEPAVGLDHPLVKEERCVILPHIASATHETRNGMATLAIQNVLGGIFGEKMPAEKVLTQ